MAGSFGQLLAQEGWDVFSANNFPVRVGDVASLETQKDTSYLVGHLKLSTGLFPNTLLWMDFNQQILLDKVSDTLLVSNGTANYSTQTPSFSSAAVFSQMSRIDFPAEINLSGAFTIRLYFKASNASSVISLLGGTKADGYVASRVDLYKSGGLWYVAVTEPKSAYNPLGATAYHTAYSMIEFSLDLSKWHYLEIARNSVTDALYIQIDNASATVFLDKITGMSEYAYNSITHPEWYVPGILGTLTFAHITTSSTISLMLDEVVILNKYELLGTPAYAYLNVSEQLTAATPTTTYYLRGYDTTAANFVYWQSTGLPNSSPTSTNPSLTGTLTNVCIVGSI